MNYAIWLTYKDGHADYLREGDKQICSFPSRAAAMRQKQAMEAELTTRMRRVEIVPYPKATAVNA